MKRSSLFIHTLGWCLLLSCVAGAWAGGGGATDAPFLVIDPGGHTRYVKDVAFTADGRQLVSAGDDKVIRVWDVATGKTVRSIRGQIGTGSEGRIYTLALSSDDKYLAVGGIFPGAGWERFAVRVYDFQAGRLCKLLKGHTDKVLALAFSPDGRRLASGGGYIDKSVRVWDVAGAGDKCVASGEAAAAVEAAGAVLGKHTSDVLSVAFSPDGLRVASGGDDTTVKLWHAPPGAAGKPDGDWKPFREMPRHATTQVMAVAYSPDGRHLVSGDANGRLFLWAAASGAFVKELARMEDAVRKIRFERAAGPGGESRLLVGAARGFSAVYSVPSGEVRGRLTHDDTVWGVAFSPDGRLAATAGGHNAEIALWNPDDKKPEARWLAGDGRSVWSVGFAHDGRSIAFGTEMTSNDPKDYGPLRQVIRLRQGDDYRVSLGGSLKGEKDYGKALTEVDDAKLALQSGPRVGGRQIVVDKLLQVTRGKVVVPILRSEFAHKSFTFTHDGRHVVSGAEGGYLSLYESATGRKIQDFSGHTSDVLAVAVSPDDSYLVSGSSDQTVKVWDLRTGDNLLTVFVAADREWVAWTPQGFYTSSYEGHRYIGWQLNRGPERLPSFYAAGQYRAHFNRPDLVGLLLGLRKIEAAFEWVQSSGTSGGPSGDGKPSTDLSNMSAVVRDVRPPVIKVISPERKETKWGVASVVESGTRILELKVRVQSETLPITTVGVSLNGFQKGFFEGPKSGGAAQKSADAKGQGRLMELEMEVRLEEGCNTLSIVAANELASSAPEIINVAYRATEKCGGDETHELRRVPSTRTKSQADPDAAPRVAPAAGLFLRASYAPADDYRWPRSMNVAAPRGADWAAAARAAAPQATPTPTPDATPAATPQETPAPTPQETPAPTPAPSPPADAPRIHVLAPVEDEVTVTAGELEVVVEALPGSPPAEVRITNNGERAPRFRLNPPQLQKGSVDVILMPGLNEIAITAFNGGAASETVKKRITYNPPPPQELGSLIFLGIGVSDYDPSIQPPLSYADDDAEELAKFFCSQDQEGGNRHFNKVHAKVIKNAEATREAIIDGLAWMNSQVKSKQDLRVLLIAGHGVVWKNKYFFYSTEQKMGEDPEKNSIHWRVIWEKLKEISIEAPALFLVDTCRAGSALPEDFIPVNMLNGVVFFASSKGDKPSREELGHGIFTKTIIEALNGGADVFPRDGYVDYAELVKWATKEVYDRTGKEQQPVGHAAFGLDLFNVSAHPRPARAGQSQCPVGVNQ